MYHHTKDNTNTNNEVLKTLRKTLTFVDTNAKADTDAGGSTIALSELCSGELITLLLVSIA